MDEQLISLCNEIGQRLGTSSLALTDGHILSKSSTPEFVEMFPLLKGVKPEAILQRCYILWLFNNELSSMLYWINLAGATLSSGSDANSAGTYSIASKLSA